MRCLKRNQTSFHYATFVERQLIYEVDEYGNNINTGEYRLIYSNPIPCEANISPASGVTVTQLFGGSEIYDKILIMDDPNTPIDEYTILWIDCTPDVVTEQEEGENLGITLGGTIIGDNGQFSPHDYVVKRVARSLNSVAIAVSKVNVRNG
jgi:hypothetical protein